MYNLSGTQFFLSRARDMLITSFLISSPSLKFTIILYLSDMTISTLLILAVRRTPVIHATCIGPSSSQAFVAPWLEHPTGVRKVIGSITVGPRFFLYTVLVTC